MKATYTRLMTGQMIRVTPLRPWRGKSERRRVLKERRMRRETVERKETHE